MNDNLNERPKKTILLKILLLCLIGIALGCFVYFDLSSYLTLSYLKEKHEVLTSYIEEEFLVASLSFFGLYILVTALSVPGAAVLTLAAGALFGLFWGLLLVSFASTIGATCAFLTARFLLKDWVSQKFGSKLEAINSGIEKEGAFYLFTLRLVPLFPFFMINLLMGLTPISTAIFFVVSQIGMLAGTIIYVNAGTQLASINSLSDILSPTLLFSFALLGVFPLIAKKVIQKLRKN